MLAYTCLSALSDRACSRCRRLPFRVCNSACRLWQVPLTPGRPLSILLHRRSRRHFAPFFHSHLHAVYDRLYWRQNQAHPCLLATTDSPPRWSLRCSPWMTSTSSVSPPARQRTARFLVSCFRSVFFLFFPRSSCSNSIYLGVCPHRLEERPLPMPERPHRPSCF